MKDEPAKGLRSSRVPFSEATKRLLGLAEHRAKTRFRFDCIGTEHLLFAICESDNPGRDILKNAGFNPDDVMTSVAEICQPLAGCIKKDKRLPLTER